MAKYKLGPVWKCNPPHWVASGTKPHPAPALAGHLVCRAPPRYAGGFACFDAFLSAPLNNQGIPHTFDPAGYPAAHALACALAAGLPANGPSLPPLALLGFSKGGIVLHQASSLSSGWG